MTEKDLIKKIQLLKDVKPRQEWAGLLKSQILQPEVKAERVSFSLKEKFLGILEILPSLTYKNKFAYAVATMLLIFGGVFGFAQYTVPGDLLFSVKKATEQSQTALMPRVDQFTRNLEIANKRLDDLASVVKDNKAQNKEAAVNEFKASVADVAKNVKATAENKESATLKNLALEVKKLETIKKQGQTLGVDLTDTKEIMELDNALAPLIESEIKSLQESTLTEEQMPELEEIKQLFGEKNYSEAMEKILTINETEEKIEE